MLPSSNYDPFSYNTIENLSEKSSTNIYDQNPNSSSQEELIPSLFSYFPFPFPDDNDLVLDDVVQQKMLMVGVGVGVSTGVATESHDFYLGASSNKLATDVNTEISNTTTEQMAAKVHPKTSRSDRVKSPNPRKRIGKKDRHSKIHTAHGPRDRRMRLSLPISKEFFGLQDLLGYDTASKTIEWLFTKSNVAIKELMITRNQSQMKNNEEDRRGIALTAEEGETLVGFNTSHEKKKSNSRKAPSSLNTLARESREKARARARERTREKMMIRSLEKSEHYCLEPNPKSLESSGTPLEAGEEDEKGSLFEVEEPSSQSVDHQLATVEIIEKLWDTPSSLASPFSIYDFQNNVSVSDGFQIQSNNNFMTSLGNWDCFNDARIISDYCAVTNKVPLSGKDHDQNPSSMFMTTSNMNHFQSQF